MEEAKSTGKRTLLAAVDAELEAERVPRVRPGEGGPFFGRFLLGVGTTTREVFRNMIHPSGGRTFFVFLKQF